MKVGEEKWRDDYITYRLTVSQKEGTYGADIEIRTFLTEDGPTEGRGICYAVENVSRCGAEAFCTFAGGSLGVPDLFNRAMAVAYAQNVEIR